MLQTCDRTRNPAVAGSTFHPETIPLYVYHDPRSDCVGLTEGEAAKVTFLAAHSTAHIHVVPCALRERSPRSVKRRVKFECRGTK